MGLYKVQCTSDRSHVMTPGPKKSLTNFDFNSSKLLKHGFHTPRNSTSLPLPPPPPLSYLMRRYGFPWQVQRYELVQVAQVLLQHRGAEARCALVQEQTLSSHSQSQTDPSRAHKRPTATDNPKQVLPGLTEVLLRAPPLGQIDSQRLTIDDTS